MSLTIIPIPFRIITILVVIILFPINRIYERNYLLSIAAGLEINLIF